MPITSSETKPINVTLTHTPFVAHAPKNRQLPDLATSQITTYYPHVAGALFGDDAFSDDGVFLKEPVRKFIDATMVEIWGRFRKMIQRERGRLEKRREEADALWQGAVLLAPRAPPHHQTHSLTHSPPPSDITTSTDDGRRPTAAKIRTWLAKVETLMAIVNRYGDDASAEELRRQRETLGDMLDSMGLDSKGRDKQRTCFTIVMLSSMPERV